MNIETMLGSSIVGVLIGGFLGYLMGINKDKSRYKSIEEEANASLLKLTELKLENIKLSTQLEERSKENDKVNNQYLSLQANKLELEKNISSIIAQKESHEEGLKNYRELITDLEKQLGTKFVNLANEILEASKSKLVLESQKTFSSITAPLEKEIKEFKEKVDKSYSETNKEQSSLKSHIETLINLNKNISDEAHNLTLALKGDTKIQGDWGEVVLERILENSGLREGTEYIRQGKGLDLKNESEGRQKPDVIINLPEDKHIVIDSKVSLVSYLEYIQNDIVENSQLALKKCIESIKKHINDLSGTQYQFNEKLCTPNLILMFVPLESALALVLKEDPSIYDYAWKRSIAIVSPTILFAMMRSVDSMWQITRQNKNALDIAERGGRLYDQLLLFFERFDDIGDKIKSTQKSFEEATKTLKDGKGNVVSQTLSLKDLGVKVQKNREIPIVLQDYEREESLN